MSDATAMNYYELLRQQEQTAVSQSLFTNKSLALELATLQIQVFPCKDDKKPAVKEDWQGTASCDPVQIEQMWGVRDYLPAIPCGAQGLVVVDCDRKPGGADGVQAFAVLCAELGIDLSQTLTVQTPSGGQHVYLKSPESFRNSVGKLASAVDVRGNGGYVIAPGATLPDGSGYRIVSGSWQTICNVPEALAALLRGRVPENAAVAPERTVSQGLASERDLGLGRVALFEECQALRALKAGDGRNHKLNIAAHSLGTLIGNGSLQRSAVEQALWDASIANGYVAKDGERETLRTIQSGIEHGTAKPRPLLPVAVNTPVQVASKRNLTLIPGSNISEQPITWLWQDYLPSGKLTLLAGAGGTGKSTIAFSFAATVTAAATWPDGNRYQQPGNVLIWSSEDDPADTIKPRLMAMGADANRYFIIAGTRDENGAQIPFDPAHDIELLREAVVEIGGVSLLVIDPIVSAVSGDMHKANDVRRSLQAIVDFAAECSCAVLGITHFAKGTAGKKSDERVIGSQAFSAFARMVLVAAKEEDSERRVFTRAKSNNSVDTGGFSYSIEPTTVKHGIIATRIVWGEALEGSSRSILAEVEEDTKEDGSAIGRAKLLLNTLLASDSLQSKAIEFAAKERNISLRTLRRAKEELGIIAKKTGFGGGWTWELPSAASSQGTEAPSRFGHVPWKQ